MIIISGKTYQHKEKIKLLGFRWHSFSKTWRADSCEQTDELSKLSGLIVETLDGQEIIDTRSHKEKFGRCEDAPCCGCCGSHPYYG